MSTWHTLSHKGLRGRRILRRFLYSQLAVRSAVMIALGREAPLVRFTVAADPPSVYLVFRLRAEQRDRFLQDLGLPPGFVLAPIRCLSEDEPADLVTLNVYRVSGITNGLRAEWSVYVADAEGVPRYLVIDARSSVRSMDPVDVMTAASKVEHHCEGDAITIAIGPPEASFTARLRLAADAPRVTSAAEWTTANDTIYWPNGVCDRTFYDAGLAAADQVEVAAEDVVLRDETRWSRYLEPAPVRTLVFRQAIEFVVSPWANLDDLAASSRSRR